MSKIEQFVVCKHTGNSKKYLFYSPTYYNIEKGDEVLVETQFGEKKATVLAVCMAYGEDVKRALCVLAGAKEESVKRVIGKYNFVKFDYSEDENNG